MKKLRILIVAVILSIAALFIFNTSKNTNKDNLQSLDNSLSDNTALTESLETEISDTRDSENDNQEFLTVEFMENLFSGSEQVDRFRNIERYFPTKEIAIADKSSYIKQESNVILPENFNFFGVEHSIKDFIDTIDVTGLIVIKDNSIVYENYYKGNNSESLTIAWSVSKSFVGALIGIAVEEGFINNIEEYAIDYIPELKDSAYENVTIKNLLQMSSGVSWNENYSDYNSDVNRFGRVMAFGQSFGDFIFTLEKDKAPGTYHRYNSSDTQLLGMIISRATGVSLSEYLESKLWIPLGMENRALWITDKQGGEFAAGGLNASLKDYARFGLLYKNGGVWEDSQLIPSDWHYRSITPDALHLNPGRNEYSNSTFGYGYQWWIMDGDKGEYCAIGIYGQFIYINPVENVVIVQSSANSNYGVVGDDHAYPTRKVLEMFRKIATSI